MDVGITMKAFLAITQGPDKGTVIHLDGESVRIGREPTCDVILSDAQVSRQHLKVSRVQSDWRLVDLNSSNGTLVNGEQLKLKALQDGDLIIVGETMMGFHLAEKIPDGNIHFPETGDTQTITVNERGLYDHWEDKEGDVSTLRRARSDLEALYRVGRAIHGIMDASAMMPKLIEMIFEEMPRVDRASLFLIEEESSEPVCMTSKVRRHRGREEDEIIFSKTMAQQILRDKSAMLTYDAMRDERFAAGESIHEQHIRSAIAAPLMSNDRVIGMLFADSLRAQCRFTVNDLRFLAAVGLQAGAVIEKALLYDKLKAEKAALQTAQAQLVQSEKLAAVGQLASGIVHDMKNPMTVILGYSGLIAKRLSKVTEENREALDISRLIGEIEEGVRHVNQVIEHLLMFASPQSTVKKATPIDGVIDDTMRFLQHETSQAGMKVASHIKDDLPPVFINSNSIKQVFINIVLNALQATEPYHGQLEISAHITHEDNGPRVDVRFADNGCGMPQEQKSRVFEPFYTTKKPGSGLGGTGLGLSVSYGIVENHGGTISVESEEGKGTTFIVSLPVAEG